MQAVPVLAGLRASPCRRCVPSISKVLVEGVGWVAIGSVLAWKTKVVMGRYAGLRGTAKPWREALDMAVNRHFPRGLEATTCL
jgi:hypothetical protein